MTARVSLLLLGSVHPGPHSGAPSWSFCIFSLTTFFGIQLFNLGMVTTSAGTKRSREVCFFPLSSPAQLSPSLTHHAPFFLLNYIFFFCFRREAPLFSKPLQRSDPRLHQATHQKIRLSKALIATWSILKTLGSIALRPLLSSLNSLLLKNPLLAPSPLWKKSPKNLPLPSLRMMMRLRMRTTMKMRTRTRTRTRTSARKQLLTNFTHLVLTEDNNHNKHNKHNKEDEETPSLKILDESNTLSTNSPWSVNVIAGQEENIFLTEPSLWKIVMSYLSGWPKPWPTFAATLRPICLPFRSCTDT